MAEWYGDRVRAKVRAAVGRGLIVAAEGVRNEAISLITSGQKSGRTYRRRGVTHQASAPGQAPASDTGTLVSRITTEYDFSALVAVVAARTDYSAHLEFGTQRMEPRPFLRPALSNKRVFIQGAISAEVKRALV